MDSVKFFSFVWALLSIGECHLLVFAALERKKTTEEEEAEDEEMKNTIEYAKLLPRQLLYFIIFLLCAGRISVDIIGLLLLYPERAAYEDKLMWYALALGYILFLWGTWFVVSLGYAIIDRNRHSLDDVLERFFYIFPFRLFAALIFITVKPIIFCLISLYFVSTLFLP